ncbi:MAG: InlB B-repeat-containing protein [Treponema sp.]|jgi:uncharacterized repeat protein (TIGR02543 family)|nr:InlB B-repeat-containing protein [Treponema sp.]
MQGEPVAKPTDSTKTEYKFDGWYKEDGTTKWNFDTDTISGDICYTGG